MKIAMFLHDLRAGGAERVSVNLANAIRQKGHQVDLVMVNRHGCREFFEQLDQSIFLHELPQKRTLTSAIGFRSYMMHERPDQVISALTHINISALIARSISCHKPRITIVEHGQFSRERAKPMSAAVRWAYRAAPWLYPMANFIATVSEGARRDLAESLRMDAEQIAVLHNPVVTETLREASFDAIDHPWFDEGQPPVILAVGALRSEKNFPLLIKAFDLLRGRRKVRLVILGDGPEAPTILKRAACSRYAQDISLLGFNANPFKYMRRAALLALSSDHEALPTVLIEAMACGTPVVATDCPTGPSEILLDGRLGSLVKTGDPHGFAGAIETTLDRPVSADHLTKRAADFSSEQAAERYLTLVGAGDPSVATPLNDDAQLLEDRLV